MDLADPPTRNPRRSWRSISLRGMLLLVLIVGAPLGWWARKAQLQRAAVARIVEGGGAVLYDSEILDADGRTTVEARDRVNLSIRNAGAGVLLSRVVPALPAPPPEPWRDRARRWLGVDFVDSVQQVIIIHSRKLKDDDLNFLADLPAVESLNLSHTPIGNQSLAAIGRSRSLKYLYLDARNVDDTGFAHLEGLDQLEGVGIFADGGAGITDAGLGHFRGMTKLKFLAIEGRNLTDAGLESLEGLKDLETLTIAAPGVTTAGLKRLQAPLPKLKIYVGQSLGATIGL